MSDTRTQLPIPDFDHLLIGDLQHRIRSLTAAEVDELVEYEKGHAHRTPVLGILSSRREALRNGATLSAGDATSFNPLAPSSPTAGGKVSSETAGPPLNPPSHGDPTNPAQPH